MLMKLLKTRATLKKMTKKEDFFVKGPFQKRLAIMWQLTAELWSMRGREYAQQRLQRNTAKLIRQ